MSRASKIRQRAESQRIIVTCSSGNEYEIKKASLRDMALIGELSLPQRVLAGATGQEQKPVEDEAVREAKAKAEANRPAWARAAEAEARQSEAGRAIMQTLALADYLRRYVVDPEIVPDGEPIMDEEMQVHESDIAEDVTEIVGYITQHSGGAEVEKLEPFPGRRLGTDSGPDGEAVRAEAEPVDADGTE